MSIVGYMNLSSLPCDGFSLLVRSLPKISKVLTFRDPENFYKCQIKHEINLVVIDYDEIVFNLDFIQQLKNQLNDVNLLILFSAENAPEIKQIIAGGNNSCWNKSDDTEVILHIIQSVLNKIRIVSPEFLTTQNKQIATNETLSEREHEISLLLKEGKTSSQIAEILHISPHTVHTHRKNIFKKLGVHSTLELVKKKVL